MINYNTSALQYIESEIIDTYRTDVTGYPEGEFLLDLRRRLLNDQALTRESQEELLPHIIAFNDALRDALKHMYDRAHELYRQMSAIQPGIELTAKCYLAYKYPALHPYQGEDRQNLFDAIAIPVGILSMRMAFLFRWSYLAIWTNLSILLSAWTARHPTGTNSWMKS